MYNSACLCCVLSQVCVWCWWWSWWWHPAPFVCYNSSNLQFPIRNSISISVCDRIVIAVALPRGRQVFVYLFAAQSASFHFILFHFTSLHLYLHTCNSELLMLFRTHCVWATGSGFTQCCTYDSKVTTQTLIVYYTRHQTVSFSFQFRDCLVDSIRPLQVEDAVDAVGWPKRNWHTHTHTWTHIQVELYSWHSAAVAINSMAQLSLLMIV